MDNGHNYTYKYTCTICAYIIYKKRTYTNSHTDRELDEVLHRRDILPFITHIECGAGLLFFFAGSFTSVAVLTILSSVRNPDVPIWGRLSLVEVLLYVHRNRRLIRDGSPGRPPRLSHSS